MEIDKVRGRPMHVYPRGQGHLMTAACWCEPIIHNEDPPEGIVIHRAVESPMAVILDNLEGHEGKPTLIVYNPNLRSVH